MRALALVLVAGCGRIGFAETRALADGALLDDAPGSDTAMPGDAAAGIARLTHTIVNGQVNKLTTAAIDTTGASLIVLAECTWSTGMPLTPTDSAGNAWTGLASYGANQTPANIRMFYAVAPATSAVHTFTDPGNDYLSIAVLAFSNTTASPFETATGATGAVPMSPGSSGAVQPGDLVVTFACSGESVATAIAIDSGFQVVDTKLNGSGGAPEDMASAFAIATSAAPVSPRWTFTGDGKATAVIAAFR